MKKKNLIETSEEEDQGGKGQIGKTMEVSLERIADEHKRRYKVKSPEEE